MTKLSESLMASTLKEFDELDEEYNLTKDIDSNFTVRSFIEKSLTRIEKEARNEQIKEIADIIRYDYDEVMIYQEDLLKDISSLTKERKDK